MKRYRPKKFSAGRWAVERERFQLGNRRQPPADTNAPDETTIGDLIPQVMKRFGMASAMWEKTLMEDWPAIAGEQVAKNTRPGKLLGTTLIVFVNNSAWLGELSRYGQKELLANLQERFGKTKIRQVRLQIDPEVGR